MPNSEHSTGIGNAMGVEAGEEEAPLLHPTLPSNSTINRTGTIWTAVAHIITGVVGSGVLSLAWSLAQLGWIAGPLAMLFFASITLLSSFLLCDCYRSPHPEFGPTRNRSYLEAVHEILGKTKGLIGGLFVQIGLYGTSIAYVVASDTSMRAIQKSKCYRKEGYEGDCEYGGSLYILLFGAVQLVLSQLPDFHNIQWLSILAAIMSFAYSITGLTLGFAQVIENGSVKGSIAGNAAGSAADKVWNVSQAIGDVAFAFPYSLIVMEIQDTLKSPPSENKSMKKATTIGTVVTTFLYLSCGGFGYAAFGEKTPGNFLTGFGFSDETYWLINFANACIVIHLAGAYQVFSQALFANIEKWIAESHPNSGFVNKNVTCKLPCLPAFQINLLRLCFRTMQRNIEAWTTKWIMLEAFSIICFLVTAFALIGSIEGLISSRLGY
ncbi:unnamed protein product [Dovyalis caffra]|uniref:Amino acid transporter transmembrane domain-containing protein n=1 Tax=Dovyalis caffra TaxID=77055 RepID=A0AAV1RUB7_9ROSI|nr:unnamed protein product [Dovyalis caffra]